MKNSNIACHLIRPCSLGLHLNIHSAYLNLFLYGEKKEATLEKHSRRKILIFCFVLFAFYWALYKPLGAANISGLLLWTKVFLLERKAALVFSSHAPSASQGSGVEQFPGESRGCVIAASLQGWLTSTKQELSLKTAALSEKPPVVKERSVSGAKGK